MYRYVEDEQVILEYVERLKKDKDQCVTFRLGIMGNLVFFNNHESEGGYVLMTHRATEGKAFGYSIDITDDREVMKAVARRESYGNKELTDENLDRILNMLEEFKSKESESIAPVLNNATEIIDKINLKLAEKNLVITVEDSIITLRNSTDLSVIHGFKMPLEAFDEYTNSFKDAMPAFINDVAYEFGNLADEYINAQNDAPPETDIVSTEHEYMKAFFDMEFTGLHQNTTPISIGIVYDGNKTFYAEFTDYDRSQVVEWLQLNVIDKLTLGDMEENSYTFDIDDNTQTQKKVVKGTREYVAQELDFWHQYIGATEENKIVFYSDCLSYDWVLLNELWGGALKVPNYIYYIPIDICPLFFYAGIDPDINREEFAMIDNATDKHNALHDALVIRACYERIMNLVNEESEIDVLM